MVKYPCSPFPERNSQPVPDRLTTGLDIPPDGSLIILRSSNPGNTDETCFHKPFRAKSKEQAFMRILRNTAIAMIFGFLALASITQPSLSQEKQFTRQQIETIIREYLLANPELLIEMSNRLDQRRQAAQAGQFEANLASLRKELYDASSTSVLGNRNGKTVIIEFSDYNCPYCRRMAPVLKQAMKDNPDIKIIMREFPILGEGSKYAARAALAAARQGKYQAAHYALIGHKGRLTQKSVDRVLAKLGLDMARLKADMNSPEITAIPERSLQLGQLLGINGTPAFIAGNKLYPGALPPEQLREMLSRAAQAAK